MTTVNESQTNRLLGYPEDARLQIINADDFGMCNSNNEAIMRALTEGVVSSTSLMTPCPWAPQAMQFLQEHPEIPFGVHLTVICDFAMYRWGPLTSANRISSLVDESGYFFLHARREKLLAQARLDELEVEFRAQINAVLDAGLKPSHLDWHCLADGGRADIFDLTVDLAKEYGLALRVHDRSLAQRMQDAGLPTNDFDVLDSYHMDPTGKPALYAQLLRELPAGLSEWAVHPSLGNAESQALEPENWQVRRADFDCMISPEIRELIDEEGVILIDYRALQKVWAR